jgi:hypothetical protein
MANELDMWEQEVFGSDSDESDADNAGDAGNDQKSKKKKPKPCKPRHRFTKSSTIDLFYLKNTLLLLLKLIIFNSSLLFNYLI